MKTYFHFRNTRKQITDLIGNSQISVKTSTVYTLIMYVYERAYDYYMYKTTKLIDLNTELYGADIAFFLMGVTGSIVLYGQPIYAQFI